MKTTPRDDFFAIAEFLAILLIIALTLAAMTESFV